MPLIFDRPLDILKMQQLPDIHMHYGHRERQATRCSHWMHPTAPYHAPLCPSCVTSRVNGTLDAALGALIAAGGPEPPKDERNQRWRTAKMRYDISKQQQSRNRVRNQLRDEREQAWEDRHQQFSSGWPQEIIPVHDHVECPACASVARYPERLVGFQSPPRRVTWWEQPGGLLVDYDLAPQAPRRSGRGQRKAQVTTRSSFIRELIRDSRLHMATEDTARCRLQSALCRKFNLNSGVNFSASFLETPISEAYCRRSYQRAKEEERSAACRARGNKPRPMPPRSSLSHCELSEDIEIDHEELEQMRRKEEAEALKRKAWKVGEQVGYLYFVGDDFDGLFDWRDDFLRSDRQMIYRQAARDTVMTEPSASSEEADSSDEEEIDDENDDNSEAMEFDE